MFKLWNLLHQYRLTLLSHLILSLCQSPIPPIVFLDLSTDHFRSFCIGSDKRRKPQVDEEVVCTHWACICCVFIRKFNDQSVGVQCIAELWIILSNDLLTESVKNEISNCSFSATVWLRIDHNWSKNFSCSTSMFSIFIFPVCISCENFWNWLCLNCYRC